ncbi:folate-binding protein [Corynebacterium sp. sy017]|uniref:CAF17-like 4Fe-4S cluster assembly/insertion protein YgfZ n=1 Tax=Corynebacterium sp. SY003 TaxID=2499164 RepID=UPI001184F17D|nr:folate-binding protein [Corynebacterium sp. sy017]TSD91079.1 folate-binding protein [Corynebacterium sp. SY003]
MVTQELRDSHQSYQSPLLHLPHASLPQGDDDLPEYRAVAWHYGDPLREQRAFSKANRGFVDQSHRRFIKVSGTDAATYLHTLFSQKLDDLAPGTTTQALDLDAQGRILHQITVSRIGEDFYLDVSAPQWESLVTYLTRMVFWSQVSISTPDLGFLSLVGGEVTQHQDIVDKLNTAHLLVASRYSHWGVPTYDVIVERSELLDVAHTLISLEYMPVGFMAYTAERVKALAPMAGIDLDDKSIPHESALLVEQAVCLNKGCYRGQETVARVANLGQSPRALVLLQLDGSAPRLPRTGEPVMVRNRSVGRVGSVVHDHDYGPIALALIKRSALASSELSVAEAGVVIDPDSLPHEESIKPGRAAINKLKGN